MITSSKFGELTPSNLQFASISDDANGLIYKLQESHSNRIAAIIKFGNVIAYRVADESVLLEYWAHKLANTSHLVWEFEGSDFLNWMEKTSYRAFAIEDGVRHFIVVTQSICLEVLTNNEPIIELI